MPISGNRRVAAGGALPDVESHVAERDVSVAQPSSAQGG